MGTFQQAAPPIGDTTPGIAQDATPPLPTATVGSSNRAGGAVIVAVLAIALLVTVGASFFRRQTDANAAKGDDRLPAVSDSLRIYGAVAKWLGVFIGVTAIFEVFLLGGETAVVASVVGVFFALVMHAIGTVICAMGTGLQAASDALVTSLPKKSAEATQATSNVTSTTASKSDEKHVASTSTAKAAPKKDGEVLHAGSEAAASEKNGWAPQTTPDLTSTAAQKKGSEGPQAESDVTSGGTQIGVATPSASETAPRKNSGDPLAASEIASTPAPKKNGEALQVARDTASIAVIPKKSGEAPQISSEIVASTPGKKSEEAIRLAIKLAVDAGEYGRAVELLDVAKHDPTKPNVSPTPG